MLTSLECLTKADEMDACGLARSLQSQRDGAAGRLCGPRSRLAQNGGAGARARAMASAPSEHLISN
jgi:hypothetical protein